MDPFEITETQRVGREEAAERLRALADALAEDEKLEYERGGLKLKLHVPDELDYKIEIELEDDEWELEVELTWKSTSSGAATEQ